MRWIVLAIAAVVYLGGARNEPLYSWREAREALVVEAAIESGDWILPLRNGNEIPTKPPLYYWLAGSVAAIRGAVDPFALRLPSALLAIATIAIVLARGGLVAALVLATCLEWIRSGTAARVDTTQAALLTAAFLAFERATRAATPSLGSLGVLYGSMGLATLAKGPTGILLPLLVGAADLAVRRDRNIGRLRPIAGLALAVAIPGIWYVLAAGRGGEEFLRQHFLSENLGRFFSPESFELPHVHAWWFYGPALLAGLAPWTPLLVPAAGHLWRQRSRLEAAGVLYPLVWLVVVFAFFSLAKGKRPVYLLSLYPAAAILLGTWWEGVADRRWAAPPWLAPGIRALSWIVTGTVAVFVAGLLAERAGLGLFARIAPLLKTRDRAELDFLAALVAQSFPALTLGAAAAALAAGLFLRTAARAADARETAVAIALVAACVASLANAIYFPAVAWRRSYAPFAAAVGRSIPPDDHLSFVRSFDHGAVLYAGRPIPKRRGDPCRDVPRGRAAWVLAIEKEWKALDAEWKPRFRVLARSEATGPRGRDPLILSRAVCGDDRR